MAKGDKISSLPKKANNSIPETPSGKFDAPLTVALEGSLIGKTSDSFEELITSTMATVLYGPQGINTTTVGGLKGLINKDNNISSLLGNISNYTNKLSTNIVSLNKHVKENNLELVKLNKLFSNVYNDTNSTILVDVLKSKEEKNKLNNETLEIILNSNELPAILNELYKLSNDEFYIKLNKIINELSKFDTILNNLTISENNILMLQAINSLGEINLPKVIGLDGFVSLFDTINKLTINEEQLSKIKSINNFGDINMPKVVGLPELDESFNLLNNLKLPSEKLSEIKSISNLGDINLPKIVGIDNYNEIFSNLQKIDLSKFNKTVEDLEKVKTIISGLNESINKTDFSKLNINDSKLTKINTKLDKVHSAYSKYVNLIKFLSEGLSEIQTMNADTNTMFSKIEPKININEQNLTDINKFINAIKGIDNNIHNILKTRLKKENIAQLKTTLHNLGEALKIEYNSENLNSILEFLNSDNITIDNEKFKNINSVLNKFVNDFNNLQINKDVPTTIQNVLSELAKNLESSKKEFDSINLSKSLKNILESLSILNNLQTFDDSKFKNLSISNFLDFAKQLNSLQYDKSTNKKIKRISEGINNLSTIASAVNNLSIDEEKTNSIANSLLGDNGLFDTLESIGKIDLGELDIDLIVENVLQIKNLADRIGDITIDENKLNTLKNSIAIFNFPGQLNETVSYKTLFSVLGKGALIGGIISELYIINKSITELGTINSTSLLDNLKVFTNTDDNSFNEQLKKLSNTNIEFVNIISTFNNYISTIKKLKKFNDNYNALSDTVISKNIDIKSYTNAISNIDIICTAISKAKEIDKKELENKINSMISILEAINPIIKGVNGITFDKIKSNKKFGEIINLFVAIQSICDASNKIKSVENAVTNIGKINEFIDILINDGFIDKVVELNEAFSKKIKPGDDKKTDGLHKLIIGVSKLAVISALSMPIIIPAIVGIKGLSVVLKTVIKLIDLMSNIDETKIAVVGKALDSISDILFKATLCCIIGGLVFTLYPKLWQGTLTFVAVFSLFLLGILGSISIASRLASEKNKKIITDLGDLVLTCTISMMIGALFMMSPNLVKGAILFTGVFSIFIMSLMATMTIASFITGWSRYGKGGSFEGVENIVLVATGALILGAAFMMIPGLVKGAIEFTGVFALFLFSVMGSISLAATFADSNTVKKLNNFIVSTIALVMLGGVFMVHLRKYVIGGLKFGAVLGLFTLLVLLPFKIFKETLAAATPTLLKLTLFVAVAGALLLFAGSVVSSDSIAGMGIFIVALFLLSATVCGLAWVIGNAKIQQNIIKSIISMALISVVIFIGSIAMKNIAEISHIIDGEGGGWKMLTVIGIMALTMVGFVAIAFVLSKALPVIGTAVLAMVGISSVILIMSFAMKIFANALQTFSKIGQIDFSIISNNITGVLGIGAQMALLSVMSPFILPASIAVSSLSFAISQISQTVAEVASLNIPIYSGKKITGYRKLNSNDFKNAATNTKLIVSTLFKAMNDVYNENKDLFQQSSEFNLLKWVTGINLGKSPLEIVISTASQLGKVISKISDSVKDYATLRVPIYGGNGKEVTGYRNLGKEDFKNAAKNVKSIILTLGRALIDVYEENKNIFQQSSEFNLIKLLTGINLSKNPLEIVISTTAQLGKVISKISDGLEDYMKLDTRKISKAGENIKTIITTIYEGVLANYRKDPTMYDNTGNSLMSLVYGIDFSGRKKSPIEKVIATTMDLSRVISSISKSLEQYAKVNIDFKKAGENISTVIKTIRETLFAEYTKNESLYKDDSLIGKVFGTKENKTPYSIVIATNMKLGTLISNISQGIGNMAKLKMPTGWDKDGKPTGYKKVDGTFFKEAGENIKTILSTIGNALMNHYDTHDDWYKNSNWYDNLLSPGSNKFSKVISTNIKLADLVKNIGDSVVKISKLQIPNQWDPKTGKAIGYTTINKTHFEEVAHGIDTIISCLGNAIITTAENHKDWFDKGEKSVFSKIMKSVGGMGNLIKDISEGIKNYAELKIPVYGKNNTEITGYKQLEEKDFSNAGKNISTIISTIGDSLLVSYESNKSLYKGGEKSKLADILNSTKSIGELISSISEGLLKYSSMQIPCDWDDKGNPIKYKSIDINATIDTVKTNIGNIITGMASSLNSVYEKNIKLFSGEQPVIDNIINSITSMGDMLTTVSSSIEYFANLDGKKLPNGKIFKLTDIDNLTKPEGPIYRVVTCLPIAIQSVLDDHNVLRIFDFNNPEKSKANVIIESISKMGDMLSSLAGGLSDVINDVDFTKLSTNNEDNISKISKVITTLANGIAMAYVGNESLFNTSDENSNVNKVVYGTKQMISLIAPIGRVIKDYAELNVPGSIESNGEKIKLDKTYFTEAGNNIGTIISTIANALNTVSKTGIFSEENSGKIKDVLSFTNSVGLAVGHISDYIKNYSELKMPILDENGKETGKYRHLIDTDFENAANCISTVIGTIGNAINTATANGNYDKYNKVKVTALLENIRTSIIFVSEIASHVKKFADLKFIDPITNKTIELSKDDFQKAGDCVSAVISTIGTAIGTATESVMGGTSDSTLGRLFGKESSKQRSGKIGMMFDLIKNAIEIVYTNASILSILAKENIPSIDKDGTITNSNEKIDKTVRDNAKTNISAIFDTLTAIVTSIQNSIQNKQTGKEKINNDLSKNIDKLILDPIKKVTETIVYVANNVNKLENIKNDTITKPVDNIKFGLEKIQNIFDTTKGGFDSSLINTNITSISTIFNRLFAIDESWDVQNTYLTNNLKSIESNIKSIESVFRKINSINTNNLNDKIVELDKIFKDFNKIGSLPIISNDQVDKANIKDTIQNTSSEIEKSLSENITKLNNVVNNELSSLLGNLNKIKLTNSKYNVTEAFELINNLDINVPKMEIEMDEEDFNSTFKKLNILIKNINGLPKIILKNEFTDFENTLTGLSTIISNANNLGSINIDNFITSLTSLSTQLDTIVLDDTINKSKTIKEKLESIYNNLSLSDKIDNKVKPYFVNDSPLVGLIKDLTEFSNLGNNLSDDIFIKYDTLSNKIKQISTTISQDLPKNTEQFKNHIGSLDTYIKSINSINVESINSLTRMMETLLKLGLNMGNLDELSKAIAEDLTNAIENIKATIEEFNTTYKAEITNKSNRKIEIDKSLEKIKNMLGKELKVKIEKPETSAKVTKQLNSGAGNPSQTTRNNTTKKELDKCPHCGEDISGSV